MAFSQQQIENLKFLLQLQSEGYKESIDRISIEVRDMRKEYDSKIFELTKSLEFTQKENDDLKSQMLSIKNENDKLNTMVDLHKRNIEEIHITEKEITQRIDLFDDTQRKSNLIISGVPEDRNENNEQCHKKAIQLFREKLDLPIPSLNAVFRIGKSTNNKTLARDILVKFNNQDQRNAILFFFIFFY